jgi:hypothetical protein
MARSFRSVLSGICVWISRIVSIAQRSFSISAPEKGSVGTCRTFGAFTAFAGFFPIRSRVTQNEKSDRADAEFANFAATLRPTSWYLRIDDGRFPSASDAA